MCDQNEVRMRRPQLPFEILVCAIRMALIVALVALRASGQIVHHQSGDPSTFPDLSSHHSIIRSVSGVAPSIISRSPVIYPDSLASSPFMVLRKTIRSKDINNPKSVRISPCGKYAYVNNLEGMNTAIIDVKTGGILRVIRHTGKPVELAFTQGGRFVWISYLRLLEEGYPREVGDEREYKFRSVVVVYDTLVQKLVARIPVGIIPKGLAVSPDEQYVFVANWRSHSVTVVDADSFVVVREIRVGAVPRGMVFSPAGRYCYVANLGEHSISIIDVVNLSVTKTISGVGLKPRHLVISSDGSTVYLSNHGDGHVRALDTKTNRIVASQEVGAEPRTIVLSPDGRFLYAVCYESNYLSVLDARSMRVLGTVATDLHPVGVDVAPDGKTVWVSNQTASTVQVFEVVEKIQQ